VTGAPFVIVWDSIIRRLTTPDGREILLVDHPLIGTAADRALMREYNDALQRGDAVQKMRDGTMVPRLPVSLPSSTL
jgi:hypothetical protein